MTQPLPPLADAKALVESMSKVHRRLVGDLRERAADVRVEPSLREAHASDRALGRTGEAYEAYRDGVCDQVAASWVLCAVFARTLEDRGYLPHRLAGPGASDKLAQFRSQLRFLGERDYLLHVFDGISLLPGGREVFGPGYAPLWRLSPTSRAVGELLDELRSTEGGALRFSFGRPVGDEHDGASTRYLGDLYQDLNEGVRKRYALLQTPEFVERFLLDHTLDPAIRERGIAVTVLDPACGSGHLLLGAYDRLFDVRRRVEPGFSAEESARKALSQVYGVDLNPYAAAVARFRLLLSYLDKAGIPKLDEVSRGLGIHVYVGDSLLAGQKEVQETFGDVLARRGETPASPGFERGPLLSFFDPETDKLLQKTRFDVIVANPPYITEKDAVKRELIRERYKSASGKYALSVPFVERIFQLGNEGAFTGQITANSFMKREFGSRLIEDVLPNLDLSEIIDTSGAFIPGHGTPTVILFGRAQKPIGAQVHVVMGIRGEPTTPDVPAEGKVWSSIAARHGDIGFEDEYISVADVEREKLAHHPWSLGGGGAAELKEELEQRAARRLADQVSSIGFMAITGEDDAFFAERRAFTRAQVIEPWVRSVGTGDVVRDWAVGGDLATIFPYATGKLCAWAELPVPVQQWLWPRKRLLTNRPDFSGKKYSDVGRTAHEYHQIPLERLRTPLSIAFAFVATHNHFVLDRGGKVFKQSAPIIKLPEVANEEKHVALLSYLNSSAACFWMKQVLTNKAGSGMGRGIQPESWMDRYEFNGSNLVDLPLPTALEKLLPYSKALMEIAQQRVDASPQSVLERCDAGQLRQQIQHYAQLDDDLRGQMMAVQEELDWAVYELWGWPSVRSNQAVPKGIPANLGARAFEVILARDGKPTAWFERHSRAPLQDLRNGPLDDETIALIEARVAAIRSNYQLALIEVPDFKRRWVPEDSAARITQACECWLLDRAESAYRDAPDRRPLSIRALAQTLSSDPKVLAVAEVLTGSSTYDLEIVLADLLQKEAVPSAKCQVYTDAGLENRRHWEHTWDLQRREDAGENVEITPPPKYDQKDFENAAVVWRHRGKLDVPKERFITYPTATPPPGASPKAGLTFGWAGWNHLEQLQATIELWQNEYNTHSRDLIPRATREERQEALGSAADADTGLRRDAAAREKLVPILQTMADLLPWIRQWHNNDGETAADFENYVTQEARRLELSLDDARSYRRPARTPARAAARASAPARSARERGPAKNEADLDAFLEAVRELDPGEGAPAADIAARLSLSPAALKKAVDALVEAGRLVEKKKRPRLVSCTTPAPAPNADGEPAP